MNLEYICNMELVYQNGRLTTTHVREADSVQLLKQLGATIHWQDMIIE